MTADRQIFLYIYLHKHIVTYLSNYYLSFCLFGGPEGKRVCLQCRRHRKHICPWVGKIPGEGNGNSRQSSCLENPMGGGAWQATVHGVTKSQTQLSHFTFFSFFLSVYLYPIGLLFWSILTNTEYHRLWLTKT